MKEIKDISKIIEEYQSGKLVGLTVLMEKARILAGQSYFYADLLGQVGKEAKAIYVQRKRKFAELCNYYRSKEGGSNSAAAAEKLAEVDTGYAELRDREAELEGSQEHGRYLFKSIDNVLMGMRQEISDLKKEYQSSKNLT